MRFLLMLTAALPLALACARAPAPPPASGAPGGPASGGAGCTEIGCQNGFQVELQPGSRWPAGRYRFDIEADGVAQQCEVTLPLQACDAGPSVRCSGAALASIGESGCALPPVEHGLSNLSFPSSPRQIRVRITRDGAALASGDFTPAYRRVQPNGPRCEPICDQASAALAIPF